MDTSKNSQSTPYYFISYCRQEVTFVDGFSRELNKRGKRTWVDFRNLVPGRNWRDQLDEGVANAGAVLLVVSKESMKSAAVQEEWVKSIAIGKRIILIIFEPCKLMDELAKLEWVDFAGNFNKAMDSLIKRLGMSAQEIQQSGRETKSPPQKGKRLTGTVILFIGFIIWLFFAAFGLFRSHDLASSPIPRDLIFDTVYAFSMLLLWLTAMWILLQAPWRILFRSHNAGKLGNAFNNLMIVSLFELYWYSVDPAQFPDGIGPILLIPTLCIFLNRLLVSQAMYRWAGPAGAIIHVGRPDITEHTNNGESLLIAVESASQDSYYAEELKASIIKAGHIITDNAREADIVLPLLSVFKTDSICDPEDKWVIPVLMQRCNVAPRLSQVQWIDLRYGKTSMDAVANLLDEPDELLRILGVLPVRTAILPPPIQWANSILLIVITVNLFFSLLFLFVMLLEFSISVSPMFVLFVLATAESYLFRRYIINRRIKYLPVLSHRLLFGISAFMALASMISVVLGEISLTAVSLAILFLVLPVLMSWKEIKLWLPVRVNQGR